MGKLYSLLAAQTRRGELAKLGSLYDGGPRQWQDFTSLCGEKRQSHPLHKGIGTCYNASVSRWCENVLSVYGIQLEIDRWATQASSLEGDITLEALVPAPSALRNKELTNWRLQNWGTGRDLKEVEECICKNEYIQYRFDTERHAPLRWLLEASKQYPSLQFHLFFFENGMENIGDLASVQNGKLLAEEQS